MPDQIPQQQAAPQSAPQQPISNDEAIGQVARGFLQEIDRDTPTDQLDPNEPAPVEEAPPQDPEAEAPETEEAEKPSLESEVPMVELDVDGEKFSVPEKLKGRFMADKDYRQKTMEVSAQKQHLERLTATAAQTAQQAQQMAPYHAHLFQMDNHAQFLQGQLTDEFWNRDPLQYNRVQGELAILTQNRERFANGLQQQVAQLSAQQLHLRQQQLALDAPKLFEEFPEIAKPETSQKLAQYVRDAGLPQEAIDFLNFSAAGTRLAWKAHQYDVMVADQKKSAAKLQERVKTLPSATQSSRAADKGAKDKQLRSDWQKRGGSINDPAFSQLLRSKIGR